MVDEVLHPGEVGVAHRRHPETELWVKIMLRYFSLAFLIMGIYNLHRRLPKRMGLLSCELIR